ncbi:MAG TPA: DUF177 domain-containing protein [Vicinamibacterales bacterium]|nr:DUF177 domain-containing protein [Vicinamibacterales bacterium]
MLTLDLNRIRTAQERFERVYSPEQLPKESDYAVVEPASLAFDIFKDKDNFRIVGDLKTVLELPCSRCLEPFRHGVDTRFDLRYQPHAMNTAPGGRGRSEGDEAAIEEDDLSTAFYENDEIDLGQLMREQFYLSLPMKPLCREDCQGLCPACGTNLNRGLCTCKRDWDDPRMAALRNLKAES